MFYIYKITNTKNQKVYIGQTKDIARRWQQHRSSTSYCRKLKHAMTKHGIVNFKMEVIFICFEHHDALNFEMFFIDEYNSIETGYNITKGGQGTVGIKRNDLAKRNVERAKVTENDIHIMQELSQTVTQKDIAKEFDISQTTVSRYVKDQNARIGNSKLTHADIVIIYSMLDAHVPQKDIAKEFNVKAGAINRVAVKWRKERGNIPKQMRWDKLVLSEEQRAQLRALAQSGIKPKKLKEQFNISLSTVYAIINNTYKCDYTPSNESNK